MEPCIPGNGWALAGFVALAIISHARGSILLLREVCRFMGRKRAERRRLMRK